MPTSMPYQPNPLYAMQPSQGLGGTSGMPGPSQTPRLYAMQPSQGLVGTSGMPGPSNTPQPYPLYAMQPSQGLVGTSGVPGSSRPPQYPVPNDTAAYCDWLRTLETFRQQWCVSVHCIHGSILITFQSNYLRPTYMDFELCSCSVFFFPYPF